MRDLEGERVMSKSKLFLEKMSDGYLKELVREIDDFERVGTTASELIWRYADTWYTNSVGLERLMCLTIDAYREAADRWLRQISVQ